MPKDPNDPKFAKLKAMAAAKQNGTFVPTNPTSQEESPNKVTKTTFGPVQDGAEDKVTKEVSENKYQEHKKQYAQYGRISELEEKLLQLTEAGKGRDKVINTIDSDKNKLEQEKQALEQRIRDLNDELLRAQQPQVENAALQERLAQEQERNRNLQDLLNNTQKDLNAARDAFTAAQDQIAKLEKQGSSPEEQEKVLESFITEQNKNFPEDPAEEPVAPIKPDELKSKTDETAKKLNDKIEEVNKAIDKAPPEQKKSLRDKNARLDQAKKKLENNLSAFDKQYDDELHNHANKFLGKLLKRVDACVEAINVDSAAGTMNMVYTDLANAIGLIGDLIELAVDLKIASNNITNQKEAAKEGYAQQVKNLRSKLKESGISADTKEENNIKPSHVKKLMQEQKTSLSKNLSQSH